MMVNDRDALRTWTCSNCEKTFEIVCTVGPREDLKGPIGCFVMLAPFTCLLSLLAIPAFIAEAEREGRSS